MGVRLVGEGDKEHGGQGLELRRPRWDILCLFLELAAPIGLPPF